MRQNIIELEKGTIHIKFPEDEEMQAFHGASPLAVIFVPKGLMQPYEALEYANEYTELAAKEARKVIALYQEFYKNWEIRISSQFTGSAATRHATDAEPPSTWHLDMMVSCRRKMVTPVEVPATSAEAPQQ